MTKRFLTLAIGFEVAARLAVSAGPSAPASLDDVLARASRKAAAFGDDFSAVTCLETIDQEKLAEDGKVLIKKHNAYDYLVLLQFSGDDLMVDESRVLQGKAAKENDRALLSTSGFSTLLFVFHPRFHASFTFSDEGSDPETPLLRRVGFEHVRGQRSPSVLQLRTREYPIEWRGTAWIDSATGNISRISVSLRAPMDDVGLRRLDSEVRYSPVSLGGKQEMPWMPVSARIEADTVHQHWRNFHQFSAYKQFSVTTDTRTEAPKETPKQ